MKKVNIIIAIVVVVLCVATIDNLSHSNNPEHSAVAIAKTHQTFLAPEKISVLASSQSSMSSKQLARIHQLPSSLMGLPSPDSLDIDGDGHLIINSKILSLFEFYLSAMGEEDLTFITTRVNDFLIRTLKSPALERAHEIFKNYLGYLNHLTMLKSEYEQSTTSLATLIFAKSELAIVRDQYFSNEVIQAFWGKSDKYEQYMLAVATIKHDQLMTLQEKQLAIEALNLLTPSWLITQQETANKLNNYRLQYQSLKENNTSSEDLDYFTRDEFGEAAAERFTALQAHRQQWQQRIAQYSNERDLLITLALTTEEFNDQLSQLRLTNFSVQESKRIQVLDANFFKKKS
jgi:lipase chaperone LimK